MPKNIVLLSDGTGNSSAKLAKTNVWRTYQALELVDGGQIAWYDDGVGTSSVRILAILGGAFGWGLKRNVLTLYKFLCRNYRAGDNVYAFGFSRGAFTIRVLIGLVSAEGLVSANSEEELEVLVAEAYRAYRKKRFKRKVSLSAPGRLLRRPLVALRNKALGFAPYDLRNNAPPPSFRFVGLWDTVDAYGMPIKELKQGIDKYIWPMSFPDLQPSSFIEEACHALSLDDERETFHPLVWQAHGDRALPDSIRQVWFSGMHSNVGGGYSDDGMAYVSLLWILGHAAAAGLKVRESTLAEYAYYATPFGRMYDSRAGLGSYYRYSPRNVATKQYPQPAYVHESVFHRMAAGDDNYAPLSMGPDIRVVVARSLLTRAGFSNSRDLADSLVSGEIARSSDISLSFEEFQKLSIDQADGPSRDRPDARVFERTRDAVDESISKPRAHGTRPQRIAYATSELKLPDRRAFELVLATIYWRRVSYWSLLILTALLVCLRWRALSLPGDEQASDVVTTLINLVRPALPSMTGPWLDGFCASPVAFCCLLAAVLSSYLWSDFLELRIRDRARVAWNVRGRGDRAAFMAQSRRRWRFGTEALLAIAAIWFLYALFDRGGGQSLGVPITFLAVAGLLFLIRRAFDSARAKVQGERLNHENPGWGLRLAHFLRTSRPVVAVSEFVARKTIPVVFAAIVVICGLWAANGVGLTVLNATGSVCPAAPSNELLPGERREIAIDIRNPCAPTGIRLLAGAKYRLDIAQGRSWQDGPIHGISTGGYPSFGEGIPRYMVLGVPLRRIVGSNWFAPMAHIGRFGNDVRPLGPNSTLIDSKAPADLYLFVNDAAIGLPLLWRHFYNNNRGELRLTIYQTESPPSF